MSTPYIGEIRMFAGNFAPRGWMLCNGQTLSIAQNAALFSILGTTYGGNGTSTFQLPNLQGRVPIHAGTSSLGTPYVLGELSGVENVYLTQAQMPLHAHGLNVVNGGGNQASPAGNFPAIESTGTSLNFSSGPPNATMAGPVLSNAGGSTPVNVVQPFLVVTFIIAIQGIFPSRN